MKFNRTFVVLMAVVCAFTLAGEVFAANRVEVKVTSEPMDSMALDCAKGGGFSLEFDRNSVITEGDQITIDLPYNTATDRVLLCNAIDIQLSQGWTGAAVDGWTAAELNAINLPTTSPVYYKDDATTLDNLTGTGAIYFRVWGDQCAGRITIDVMGSDPAVAGEQVVVGDDPEDLLVINFLDGTVNADYLAPNGFYLDPNNDGIYDTGITQEIDDTLCLKLDTTQAGDPCAATGVLFSGSTVLANMDSQADKFTFIPTNPQIAHIAVITPMAFAQAECGKAEVGTIPMGAAQQSACVFDFEELGLAGAGGVGTQYCADHLGDHRFMYRESTGAFFPDDYTYTVTLTILVDGSNADNGVYFTDDNGTNVGTNGVGLIGFSTRNSDALICNDLDDTADERFNATIPAGWGTGYADGDCVDAGHARRLTMTYPANFGNIAADHDYLWVDIPTMAYKTEGAGAVTSGQMVQVQVSINATNTTDDVCGGRNFVIDDIIDVGRFVSDCGQNFSVVFPYLTDVYEDDGVTAAPWWSGLAITNMGNLDGTADIYLYEADGDTAMIDNLPVAAHSIEAWALGNNEGMLYAENGFTITSGTTMGDSRSYIVVCADFNIDGFCLLGNAEYGYAQGYLPRTTLVPEECD